MKAFAAEEFRRERLEALRSLDEPTIRRYGHKYGAWMSENPRVFWGSVHKARLVLPGLSDAERRISREWLLAKGLKAEVRL